ncbi:MAG: DUF1553 domain-containing protein, partial [Verrucomicrobiales bacterium]|nr:DUF1553 domain-containing protein [Verrucomicrobiales bacterium]
GTHDKNMTGILYVWNGKDGDEALAGTTVIIEKTWNHVVMVRDGNRLRVFLNGWKKPEIDTEMAARAPENRKIFVAARNDHFAPLTGALTELAVFDRAITNDEANRLHADSGQQPKAPTSTNWAMGVRDLDKIEDCKINIDGDSKKLGGAVPRGFITACKVTSDAPAPDQSGRLQLAQWLTHPGHPLTARVMVNRIWLHLFGQAIVSTPDDFGIYGSPPTHPQLLDHLATRFVSGSWSLKNLIRTIVLSRTYQIDSKLTVPQLAIIDPDNLLFGRHNRRRLDAEALRDSILKTSGALDPTPATSSAVARIDKLINWPPGEATHLHQPSNHRSVYLCILRNSPPPELAPFNFPDGRSVTGKRDVTTVPAQALFLMNSPFVVEQSRLLARKIQHSNSGASDRERIVATYQTVLQRTPTPAELSRATTHLTENRNPDALSSLCHALLASNEFRYID